MSGIITYVNDFFRYFKLKSDFDNQTEYSQYFRESLIQFLENETKGNAMEVYQSFFDSYKITKENRNFIDILDVLKNYEENAATLIDKQRDHYIHSVNVFVLGLAIYSQNKKFRDIVRTEYEFESSGKNCFGTDAEEFFFRWGIASLCHDIGYPVEIMNNQIKKFIQMVTSIGENSVSANPYLAFKNFDVLNCFSMDLEVFNEYSKWSGTNSVNMENSIDLLSHSFHERLKVDYSVVREKLNGFIEFMQESGFVDHGFYSAIIVLKWYAHMVNMNDMKQNLLYGPVLDASSAILLHNYYKNTLMKPPFSLTKLKASDHPIAYLLILCDELQDWNREAYGIEDKKKIMADASRISISENIIKAEYITPKGELGKEFTDKKNKAILSTIDLIELFCDGLDISNISSTDLYIEMIQNHDSKICPRPLLMNLQKIAEQIHYQYNKVQLERNPEKQLEYPNWESLPQSLKYSNVRQARAMTEKMSRLGYQVVECIENGTEILKLTVEETEYLAKVEHDSWMKERVNNGWQYGAEKNVTEKISPYILPYEQLSEDIKQLDRDAVRNVIPMLNSVGLRVLE